MKFKENLQITNYWQYDPAQPAPSHLPVQITTGLRGPQCLFTDAQSGNIYHLAPMDCMVQVNGNWLLMNAITANVLLEEGDD